VQKNVIKKVKNRTITSENVRRAPYAPTPSAPNARRFAGVPDGQTAGEDVAGAEPALKYPEIFYSMFDSW